MRTASSAWSDRNQRNVYVRYRLNSRSARIRTKERQVLEPRVFQFCFVLAKFGDNVLPVHILYLAIAEA
jgi:hypothetical protein